MVNRFCLLIFAFVCSCASTDGLTQESQVDSLSEFLSNNCFDCHSDGNLEAGLDLKKLYQDRNSDDAEAWVKVFDRVHDGEMPPADYLELESHEKSEFLDNLGGWIQTSQVKSFETLGRSRGRRLTNLQLERTLHDVLGIDIPLATHMPEEPRVGGFTNQVAAQSMSRFHLAQHLKIVDLALDEAWRRVASEPDEWKVRMSATQIARRNRRQRTREPEMRDGQAVTWSGTLPFYGRIPATTARKDGWYRFRIHHQALKAPKQHGVWCSVRSGICNSGAPLLSWIGAFEATQQHGESTFEAWLPRGHMIEVRPADATLKKARFRGGQVGTGEAESQDVPGLAIDWIEMERIHRGPSNATIRKLLFADLEIGSGDKSNPIKFVVRSPDPAKDIGRLMKRFAQSAFRRPVDDDSIKPFIDIARSTYADTNDFAAAIRIGYRSLLCSPRFLYFDEAPGKLDHWSIASRLSYMLWNRPPDQSLLKLAKNQQLQSPGVLKNQVDRMLRHAYGQNFVRDFADQWLDLNLIEFTEPDRRLYPGFDVVVQDAMLAETHRYLQKMVDDDLPVRTLIDSDFSFMNSRLARYYGIDKNIDQEMQLVSLSPGDHRGGIVTHGSILKVTANGTTTSPVIRGVWVSERLLGQPIPNPPENVPAIEPDIRGAKSIREMLAKHKENGECASCHRKIDPPGFALENFDPSGRWRDNYPKIVRGRLRGDGAEIDAGFEMPDGQQFSDLTGFQKLVLEQPEKLASCVTEKLAVLATGVELQFADRSHVADCVDAAADHYGFRSLIQSFVVSPIFLNK